MNAITIKALTKRYENLKAVNNFNLTIKQGELFALLGVNGSSCKLVRLRKLGTCCGHIRTK